MNRHYQRDLRLFFATDLQGSERAFRKFINSRDAYEADILVLSGNLTGVHLIPIARTRTGWVSSRAGRTVELSTKQELMEFTTRVADEGAYAVHGDWDPSQDPTPDLESELDELFVREARARINSWMGVISDRQIGDIFMSGGNADPIECLDEIATCSAFVTPSDGRSVALPGGRTLITSSLSPPSPWRSSREIDEDDLAARLRSLFETSRESDTQVIFATHAPPYDSGLDSIPILDDDLQPVSVAGQELRRAGGSTAIRAVIEHFGPILSLHGQVLDGRGASSIGPTLCLNPGSEAPDGILLGALIDFDSSGIVNHVLTAG